MGITPGQTTITETVQILNSRDDIQITDGPSTTIRRKSIKLTWEFTTPLDHIGANVFVDSESRIVSLIDLGVGGDHSLSLSGTVKQFGEPDFVRIIGCQGDLCGDKFYQDE